ncbi:hypothetical protein LB504_005377 [Fusarium proliferatum]|nr:hypothetical protein LB504_005377 [Fusarium proliferatum]
MQAIRNADLNMILNFSQPALIDETLHILVARHAEVASYVWTFQAVWDLNRVGRANMNLFSASLWILLALVSFGPGASVAGVWYIREHAMSRTSFQKKQAAKNTQFHDGDAVMTGASGITSG